MNIVFQCFTSYLIQPLYITLYIILFFTTWLIYHAKIIPQKITTIQVVFKDLKSLCIKHLLVAWKCSATPTHCPALVLSPIPTCFSNHYKHIINLRTLTWSLFNTCLRINNMINSQDSIHAHTFQCSYHLSKPKCTIYLKNIHLFTQQRTTMYLNISINIHIPNFSQFPRLNISFLYNILTYLT